MTGRCFSLQGRARPRRGRRHRTEQCVHHHDGTSRIELEICERKLRGRSRKRPRRRWHGSHDLAWYTMCEKAAVKCRIDRRIAATEHPSEAIKPSRIIVSYTERERRTKRRRASRIAHKPTNTARGEVHQPSNAPSLDPAMRPQCKSGILSRSQASTASVPFCRTA